MLSFTLLIVDLFVQASLIAVLDNEAANAINVQAHAAAVARAEAAAK